MKHRIALSLWVLIAACSFAAAEAPPAIAPGAPSSVTLQPVAVYDGAGNVVSSFGGGSGGSASAPGSREQDTRASNTLNAATANAAVTLPINGQATVGFTFTGLAASGATVTFEQSNDGGTTWTGVNEVNAGTGIPSATRSTDGQTRVAVQGRTNLRVRVSTTGIGTITVASNISVREGLVTLASPLPPGTNTVGAVLPPVADTGKITQTPVSVPANASTQLVAANAARIAIEIQCDGTAIVGVSRTGAALTSAAAAPLVVPAGSYPLYTMPVATLTAITAYTATAQTCRVTEYLR